MQGAVNVQITPQEILERQVVVQMPVLVAEHVQGVLENVDLRADVATEEMGGVTVDQGIDEPLELLKLLVPHAMSPW